MRRINEDGEIMAIGIEDREYVKLFDGHMCKSSNVVGYCHSAEHRGYISKALLGTHECIEKQCSGLQKLNPGYWEALESAEREKRERRKNAKFKRQKTAERDEYIRSILEAHSNLYVTAIREETLEIVVSFIFDGWIDLREENRILSNYLKCRVRLNAVRTSPEIRRSLIRRGYDEPDCAEYYGTEEKAIQ